MLTYDYEMAGVPEGTRLGDHVVDTILSGRCFTYRRKPAAVSGGQPGGPLADAQPEELTVLPLNPTLFANHPVYSRHRLHERLVERPFSVHYNWLVGVPAKVAAMRGNGHWLLGSDGGGTTRGDDTVRST
jgi:hypothetical protein